MWPTGGIFICVVAYVFYKAEGLVRVEFAAIFTAAHALASLLENFDSLDRDSSQAMAIGTD